MPTMEISYCDECNQKLKRDRCLIYAIKYWNCESNKIESKDFIKDNDEAAMFCGNDCMGRFLYKLFNTV